METGLRRDLDTGFNSVRENGQSFDGREVDDVERKIGCERREGDDLVDGICFKCRWPRGEERAVGIEWTSWSEWWVTVEDSVTD